MIENLKLSKFLIAKANCRNAKELHLLFYHWHVSFIEVSSERCCTMVRWLVVMILLRGSVAVAWMAGAHLWLCGFEEILGTHAY